MEELPGFHSHHEGDVEPFQVFKQRSDTPRPFIRIAVAAVLRKAYREQNWKQEAS